MTLPRLESILADLYPDKASINRIAQSAGIDTSLIGLSDRAIDSWHAVLVYAEQNQKIADLLAAPLREYPANVDLHAQAFTYVPLPVNGSNIITRIGVLERRLLSIEQLVFDLAAKIDPGPRHRVSRIIVAAVLFSWWSSVLVPEIRTWYITNIVQALVIAVLLLVACLIVWWLPGEGHK